METACTVTGVMGGDGRSVLLDKPLPSFVGKVRVTVEELPPAASAPELTHDEVLAAIHARLKAAGHTPPTVEEVARRVAEERDSWA